MNDFFYLAVKCAAAAGIMIIIHFVSKTENYYLSAVALGFPALSMTAYLFMYMERGGQSVIATTAFAALTVIPFLAFLAGVHILLKYTGIAAAFLASISVWAGLTICIIYLWKNFR